MRPTLSNVSGRSRNVPLRIIASKRQGERSMNSMKCNITTIGGGTGTFNVLSGLGKNRQRLLFGLALEEDRRPREQKIPARVDDAMPEFADVVGVQFRQVQT